MVQDLCRLAQFDTEQGEGTIVYIPALTNPREFQTVVDVDGGKHLWINQGVDTHILEKFLVLRTQIFKIVNTGNGLLRTKAVGNHTSCEIGSLVRGDTHE